MTYANGSHRDHNHSNGNGSNPSGVKRPNFLLIVADDLGYSDLSCFGSEIKTPRIDSLAKDGLRMTDFHSAAACSPTRAMLMSGTDAHLSGLGVMYEQKMFNVERWDKPGHEGYLNLDVASMPELLKEAGYYTTLSGKWHLGFKKEHLPCNRGFDSSYALLPGCCNHYGWEPQFSDKDFKSAGFMERATCLFVRGEEMCNPKPNTTNDPDGFFSSDAFATELIDSLDNRTGKDAEKPFFAYLAFSAPHLPLQCPKAYREPYKGMYDDGPDALRLRRLARLREMGLLDESARAHEVIEPWMKEWQDMTDEERAKSSRSMEVYAGMVSNMDFNVGRVLDYLTETNQRDNTVVIFMSDNGAEGASYEMLPTMGANLLKVIDKHYDNSLDNIGEYNSWVWYGGRWAQAATAPHRLYKKYTTEGGIRVPFIVEGRTLFNADGKQVEAVSPAFATAMDIMPTFLEMAGVKHPVQRGAQRGTWQGRKVHGMRGKSMVSYLQRFGGGGSNGGGGGSGNHRASANGSYSSSSSSSANANGRHQHSTTNNNNNDVITHTDAIHTDDDPAVGWELFGRAALRHGRYKIVQVDRDVGGTMEDRKWELFDVELDPGETVDLADWLPDVLLDMERRWQDYVAECGVVWGELVVKGQQPDPTDGAEDPMADIRNWMAKPGTQRSAVYSYAAAGQ